MSQESGCPLEARKDKEINLPLGTPEKTQPYQHL